LIPKQALMAAACLAVAAAAEADPVVHVPAASTWKFLAGTAEASEPDPASWRAPGFDDADWTESPAPFGYGDLLPYGTDLSLLAPPMRSVYSSFFLRRVFLVPDPSQVTSLEANVNFDDGLVAWVNGVEVLRLNVRGAPGDPVAHTGFALGEHEAGALEGVDLPDPAGYLLTGANVLSVQVFNATLNSLDCTFDLELVDPEGPDRTPPAIIAAAPAPGAAVRALARAEVTFSEDVAGVEAADLLVAGVPAGAVAGAANGPYVFSFPQPAAGTVEIRWADAHGIHDLAETPNPFAGGAWTVTLDPSAPPADVVLSEVLAGNRAGLKDEDGAASDWVEVWNRGALPVDLAGWSLSDARDEPGWTLPSRLLAPGEYLVVFASGKDRRPASGNLHADFQLNAAGEYLALYGPETPRRVVMEFPSGVPESRTDYSWGLDESGGFRYFATPTPGAPNAGALSFPGFVREPAASVPRGLHDAPFAVELTTPTPGASIHFTLDGSEPTEASPAYTGPIPVAGTPGRATVTIRALAAREGWLPSRAVTWSYIFPAAVLRQPARPAGFPATWGAAQVTPGDYAMDARIIDDPAHAPSIARALASIPTLSVVMDVSDLFGTARGIYSNPSFEGPAWERAASAELLVPGGTADDEFQIDCGIRIQGGSSTDSWKALKLSLRLFFKEAYGPGRLEHRFFPDSRASSFDTLVLDAHLNLTWNHPDHGQRVRSQYVRDQFVSDLCLAMGNLAPHGRFVHLYLNGLYWGLYDVHERPDGAFGEAYLGGDKDEYDVLRHTGTEVVAGNLTAWNVMMRLARSGVSANARYEGLQAYLDVPGFIDYMIANIWAGNDDWPRHNWYAARRRRPGERFRFFSWDAEHVLKDVAINQTSVNLPNSPAEVYSLLRTNAEFRLLFADHVHRHFLNGGPLYPAHPERNQPAALYMRRIAEIDAAIAAEAARWGDARRPGLPYTRNLEWQAERDWLLGQYFPRRSAIVLAQLRAAGLYPALAAPSFNRHGGPITPGFSLAMAKPEGTGGAILYTLDGSDPREYGTGAVAPAAATYTGPITLNQRAHVKARVHDAGAWSALNEAVFTIDAPLEPLRITEVMYHPDGGNAFEFIELENTGGATLELGGAAFVEGIQFLFPPNTPLAPGAFLVLAGDAEAFAAMHPGVPIAGVFAGNLDNAGERIALADPGGIPLVAFAYDDERAWPVAADGFAHSLVLADPEGDPGHPESWRASASPGGSPGFPDPDPAHGGVVISEVLARSGGAREDAVELHNPTGRSIAIGGWFLSDQREDATSLAKFRIPDGTVLPAGGRMVFYRYQFDPSPGDPASFELPDAGGAVYLTAADAAGTLTGYIAAARFDAAEDGVSFGRLATSNGVDFAPLEFPTFGADSAASVAEFRTGAGAPNAPPRVGPVVVNEIRYHPPALRLEFIELHNLAGEDAALHDPALGRGWVIRGLSRIEGPEDFEFGAGAQVPANGYALVVAGDPEAFRLAHGVPAEAPIFGPYGGVLDNGGERIRLMRPLAIGTGVAHALADEVRYDDDLPWPAEPDGGESTLERKRPWEYGNDAANWTASFLPGGTPGAINTVSPIPGVNRAPVALFTAEPPAGLAPLAVTFRAARSFDPDGTIAEYTWTFGDGESASGATVDHTFAEPGAYPVSLRVTDDQGAQGTAVATVTAEAPPPPPTRVPLDITGEGRLNITDPIAFLRRLFLGDAALFPCGDGTLDDPANRALLDGNGDGIANLSDVIHTLSYLFAGGPPPALGRECAPIAGCSPACP
jgi:hypothetical protein